MSAEQILSRLDKRIKELEQFLAELEEAKNLSDERDTLSISSLAGMFERNELESLQKIRGHVVG